MTEPKTKIYITSERNFRLQAGRGMSVGSEFTDHGATMVITKIGAVREEGKERLINVEATEKVERG